MLAGPPPISKGIIMSLSRRTKALLAAAAVVTVAVPAAATHSWNNYHWARTSNPFTLSLGDNVTAVWDTHLRTASTEWNLSTVLDTVVQSGRVRNVRTCKPTLGRVEICNAAYGQNGWLGIASIWANGDHITQGTVKMNDTYFNMAQYNRPEWRLSVMCQEIGHTFGLDHQDEDFTNPNLGTCMDYTSNILGPPSNVSPNAHDFEQLEIIYEHLDSTSTVGTNFASAPEGQESGTTPGEWGRAVAFTADGRGRVFVRDLGRGQTVTTFVLWIPNRPGRRN